MLWKCTQHFNENGDYVVWYTTPYEEKILGVRILYESKSQAILESRILSFDNEEEPSLEYYWKKLFVIAEAKILGEKVKDEIKLEMKELERRVNEQVCIIFGEDKL